MSRDTGLLVTARSFGHDMKIVATTMDRALLRVVRKLMCLPVTSPSSSPGEGLSATPSIIILLEGFVIEQQVENISRKDLFRVGGFCKVHFWSRAE